MAEKIVRDPVHDVIAFRLENPVESLLFQLLNAEEFQRLRRIRQLGLASLAYPGADHSRYSHSLGVMQTARKILARLAGEIQMDQPSVTACLAAALLHDLGHGPFSHVFERVSGIKHERLTQRLILDPQTQVHQILIRHDKLLPERVVELLRRERPSFYADILCSQLDADRLDYLLRDNLMTGSRYGDYDITWLLHALTVDPGANRLAVSWKGVSAVEAYLQARYHMYRNVYFHKVVRSAEGMVRLTLQRARRLAVQDRLPWPGRDSGVFKALTGMRLTAEEFVDFDDISILQCFKTWSQSEDAPLVGLCRGLLYRRLYKSIDLSHLPDRPTAAAAFARAQRAVETAGGDPAYDLFLDEAEDTPYEAGGVQLGEGVGDILVKQMDGRLVSFSELSPITRALCANQQYRRIHVAAPYRDAAARAANQ
jgi:HD superfamily phosphohydrolase